MSGVGTAKSYGGSKWHALSRYPTTKSVWTLCGLSFHRDNCFVSLRMEPTCRRCKRRSENPAGGTQE